MSQADKIKMLEAMIRRNPNTTVKDFAEAIAEIEGIEKFNPKITTSEKIFNTKRN
jgi:hypothetical protein